MIVRRAMVAKPVSAKLRTIRKDSITLVQLAYIYFGPGGEVGLYDGDGVHASLWSLLVRGRREALHVLKDLDGDLI